MFLPLSVPLGSAIVFLLVDYLTLDLTGCQKLQSEAMQFLVARVDLPLNRPVVKAKEVLARHAEVADHRPDGVGRGADRDRAGDLPHIEGLKSNWLPFCHLSGGGV